MVGYVMAVWGLTTMLSSVLLGFAARYTGRPLLCTFAAVVDMTIMLTLLLWKPHGSRLPAFFALAALMGLVDGVWMVQMNGKMIQLELHPFLSLMTCIISAVSL